MVRIKLFGSKPAPRTPPPRDAAATDWEASFALQARQTRPAAHLAEEIVARLELEPDNTALLTELQLLHTQGQLEHAEQLKLAGDGAAALKLYEASVRGFEAQLGAGDQRTLQARHELANALRQQGEQEQALAHYAVVSVGYTKNLGPADAETLMAQLCEANNARELASRTLANGDVMRARQLYEKVIPGYCDKFGLAHQATLNAESGLFELLVESRAVEEAELLRPRVVEGLDAACGSFNFLSAYCRSTHGELLHLQGRPTEAEQVLRQVLTTQIQLHGSTHAYTEKTRARLDAVLAHPDGPPLRVPDTACAPPAVQLIDAVTEMLSEGDLVQIKSEADAEKVVVEAGLNFNAARRKRCGTQGTVASVAIAEDGSDKVRVQFEDHVADRIDISTLVWPPSALLVCAPPCPHASVDLDPLPIGWIEQISKSTGAKYYFNEHTGESTYNRPVAEPLPAGWTEQISTSTGAPYYFNELTGESTYERPTAEMRGVREDEVILAEAKEELAALKIAAAARQKELKALKNLRDERHPL